MRSGPGFFRVAVIAVAPALCGAELTSVNYSDLAFIRQIKCTGIFCMNYNHITQAYQNAERQALEEMNDPHLIVLTMFDALLKSMQIFETNIDLKNGGDAELKSKHFARALTIIYALQSSLDFEKGENIATNLFQLYEFARQQLIADLSKGKADGTIKAIEALREIRDAWETIGPQVKK